MEFQTKFYISNFTISSDFIDFISSTWYCNKCFTYIGLLEYKFNELPYKIYNSKHHKLRMISQILCSIGREIKFTELHEWLGLNINQYSCCYVIDYFADNAWIMCSPNYINLNISYYMIQWLPDNYKAPIVSYDINLIMFINNS